MIVGFEADRKYGLSSFWCNALPYMAAVLPSIFHTTAIWLTVYLAIQRYIYICVPTLVRRFCTIYRSKQVIFVICIASVLMYIPDVLAFENESFDVMDYKKNATRRMCYRRQTWLPKAIGLDLFYNLTFCAQTVFVHLIPCAMLVVFTWKLVRAIQIADKRHATLLNKSTRRKFSEPASCESSDPDRNCSKLLRPRESVSEPRRGQGLKQNTRMLIVVIVLFLVTEIPAALIFISHVLSVSLKSYVINYQLLNVLLIVRNVLIVISYPFRFAIYCGMSQQFRDVVRQMFTGKLLPRVVHEKDNSTTMALVQTITERESDEKRPKLNSSVIICSNGLMSALPGFQIGNLVKVSEKGVQCGTPCVATTSPSNDYSKGIGSDIDTREHHHHKTASDWLGIGFAENFTFALYSSLMISEKVLLLWMRIGSRDLRNPGSFHKFYVCRKHDRRSSRRYFYDSRSFWRGGSRCYCFAFHKNKRNCKTYKCIQCCKDGHFTQIDVVGDVFQEDPCRIPHRCLPKKIKTNSLERFLYQKLQNIRSDPAYADTPVRRLWQDMLDVVPLMENLSMEEVEELMDEFHKGGYAARRRTIAKALQRHDMPRATLEDLPNDLKNLPDGSLFLQHSQPGLYMFYSRSTLEKAVNNGLIAIVADGIHNLPPCELGKDAQLYTVHGVCNAGVDVPLVHVLMRRKTQSFYEKVFGIVKEELQDLNVDLARLRIVIDFERAALSAIRKQCPSSPIEGCAFHLAQSWNRKAQSLGLRSEMKQRRVSITFIRIGTVAHLQVFGINGGRKRSEPATLPSHIIESFDYSYAKTKHQCGKRYYV
ncbi:unnamed protein product [Cylicocyclus nassatus]|uniref:G-protein coupled receptors family 1 profile domain-containing protein n=1 Tax=Cylicocyclus nassatus TaxID=53992 RepID=A0AA36HDP8_CYLNA|nr:unnamed protein product [Cylicocyclus nassatus]